MHVSPSVRLSMYSCEQNAGRIYYPIEMKFCKQHLDIIGKNLDIAPIYIFVRFAFYCAPNV